MKDYLKELVWVLGAAVLITILSVVFLPVAKANDDYRAFAEKMEGAYALPVGILRAICDQETRWRNVAGRHGEIGPCQVKPDTVKMVCSECAGNASKRYFQVGSRGFEVMRIQAVLAREGMYAFEIDGIFGSRTDAALRIYQRRANIAVDGIVGPRTWRMMFGEHDPFPGQSIAEALWDPYQNIEWAARYLAWIKENVSDDLDVMAAAYNGGPANQVVRYMVQVRNRYADSLRPPHKSSTVR